MSDNQHYQRKMRALSERQSKRYWQRKMEQKDAERYRTFCAAGWPICFLGTEYRDKAALDAAIDAVTTTDKGKS
ncbi:hypothetical protein [Cupriavidus gilardii]|uniref:hypothetical protein n=1 Tax=Cupriavidus gilardii TaxID=82541 RepID=UPI0021B17981|nr:hypothetical protein [Cupriavidus gilardii]UXC38237.1 hypothetical protein N4G38_24565 [Cupriavidus gilardii]